MKKSLIFIIAIMVAMSCFVGCMGTTVKYCAVSGCPKQRLTGTNYCAEHKCTNFSCKNRSIGSYSYCQECIHRGN